MTGFQTLGGPDHAFAVADRAERPASATTARKPEWLKKPLPRAVAVRKMESLLREHRLHTVCESALCPNRGECFTRGTATFLVMGELCTRDCAFCGVAAGAPDALDPAEPERVAEAAACLGLGHVVITSVTRDDIADGGAGHYAATMRAIRARLPRATLEVLVPDFSGRMESAELVLIEEPEVFNHNLETIPRLYRTVRKQADYQRSLGLLRYAAERGTSLVKTGLMVGLGETEDEVWVVLEGVAAEGVSIVTIGQYLRPSALNLPVAEYVRPETFERYRERGEALGLQVHAAPFVRSSFRAGESFAQALQRDKSQSLHCASDAEIQ
jgi:lipoic acid synthetase